MSRVLLLAGLLACLAAGETPRAAVLTVRTVQPVRADWPMLVRADGDIAAWQEAVVGAAPGGLRILQLQAEIGDHVRAGQELAVLDTATLRAQVAAQQAEVEQAEAALTTAAADARRAEELRDGGTLTVQQTTQYLSAERSARGRLDAARAQLEVQRLALERARVVAPDDGTVIARAAVLGEVVPAGGELFRLIRQGRLEWRAEVVAADLPRLAAGQPASVVLPGGGTIQGTVRSIAPSLSARSRTALVYVDLPEGAARAGMFASGDITAGAPAAALTVPAAALLSRDGRSLVFAVDGEGTVRERRVTTGRRRDGQVEITAGLAETERIVASGGAFLADGDRVTVVP